MHPEAIEQCAYCHAPNPVTYYEINDGPDAVLTARIPICQECLHQTGR